LIISGGLGHARAAANPLVVAHVQRLAKVSRRVASVCTGASVLAAAGLLDGKRATTHWRFADGLAAQYPTSTSTRTRSTSGTARSRLRRA
jgi:transcriptional regulator GlxA family with amidase domain